MQFPLALPVAITCERRRTAQLIFCDVGPISAQAGVIGQLAPGNRVLLCPSKKRCFKLGAMTFLLGTVAIESRLVGGSLDYPHVVEGYGAPLLSESF